MQLGIETEGKEGASKAFLEHTRFAITAVDVPVVYA